MTRWTDHFRDGELRFETESLVPFRMRHGQGACLSGVRLAGAAQERDFGFRFHVLSLVYQ
jgi:hypothetical protein